MRCFQTFGDDIEHTKLSTQQKDKNCKETYTIVISIVTRTFRLLSLKWTEVDIVFIYASTVCLCLAVC